MEVGAELPPRARELLSERARILSDAPLTRPEPRGGAARSKGNYGLPRRPGYLLAVRFLRAQAEGLLGV